MNLRVVDANLNRLREGLRVLEEVARFLVESPGLTEELKRLRHQVSDEAAPLARQLLDSRRSTDDVGAFGHEELESSRVDLLGVVTANSRRAEESLRVLEEFGKLPVGDMSLDWEAFKRMRFALYDIERRLTSAAARKNKRSKISGLYVVVDQAFARGRSIIEVSHRALMGGARVIHLRNERGQLRELLAEARELKKVCAEFDALLVVNGHADVAVTSGVDGLHVERDDLPIPAARQMLAIDQILGCSVGLVQEAREAEHEGVDYVSVGTIFSTASRASVQATGIETLRLVKAVTSLPVVAIGSIDEGNIEEVVRAGADAIGVITAVVAADDVEQAARRLVTMIEAAR